MLGLQEGYYENNVSQSILHLRYSYKDNTVHDSLDWGIILDLSGNNKKNGCKSYQVKVTVIPARNTINAYYIRLSEIYRPISLQLYCYF